MNEPMPEPFQREVVCHLRQRALDCEQNSMESSAMYGDPVGSLPLPV